ncbi:MAG: hypothetical protein V7K18_19350 [Nostoc sp.]
MKYWEIISAYCQVGNWLESHDQGRSPSLTSAIEEKALVEKVFR